MSPEIVRWPALHPSFSVVELPSLLVVILQQDLRKIESPPFPPSPHPLLRLSVGKREIFPILVIKNKRKHRNNTPPLPLQACSPPFSGLGLR